MPLLLAVLVLAASPALARADAVSAIEVRGTTRTVPDVVVRALGVHVGDEVADEDVPLLRQRVDNLKLFREVEVTKRAAEAGVVLSVAVQERWTLVPLPILGASDGAVRGGLALIESNLFGRNKLVAVAGMYSSRGQTGYFLYEDPALLGTRAVLNAEVLAENEQRERGRGLDVVYAWRERLVDASLRPGLLVAPRLALRAGPFVVARSARAAEGHAAPPQGGTDFGVAADLEYLGQDYRGWFDSGPRVRARSRASLPALGSARRFTQASLELAWALPVLGDHAASAAVQGWLAEGDPVLDAFRLGARPGSRGLLEGGLWVERAVTATVDWQIPVWRPAWGTAAALAFVDAGASTWSGERTRWIAPGAGVRVYVRDVALPALGLDVAWSSAGRAAAASFFLGFGT